MSNQAKQTTATIIPCVQYEDARAAIDWLCQAFGFEAAMVVEGENGRIDHAQLRYGNGMIMVSTAKEEGFSENMRQPKRVGGETQSSYIVVDDADGHYQHAKAAGANIIMEIADQPYGGRVYSCKDPEEHMWSFGSYDPWA